MIQVFGIKGSPATRAAERFFKERGVKIQFIDLKQKAMAPGEIRRFVEHFGLPNLLDLDSMSYLDSGLKYLKVSERELREKIEKEPRLLKLPFVRESKRVSIGHDEEAWKAMLQNTAS